MVHKVGILAYGSLIANLLIKIVNLVLKTDKITLRYNWQSKTLGYC